ncbi:uncharacterized protein [Antedon mediterranea]|uniref:uncharacterized protein n=1 Tax=Antedon mediterranea TaxID=105859 RepID=UPI003AF7B92A
MTLFPKMDSETTDKDDKPDNTSLKGVTDRTKEEDEEYKVIQLFREIIAKFSSEDDKKEEGEASKNDDVTMSDDVLSPDGSRVNSPVPNVGGDGQYGVAMPDDNTMGQDETAIDSEIKQTEYVMPNILPDKILNFLKAEDGGISLVCVILNASIMQLIFGVICISLGIAAIVIKIPAYHIGDPIWTGFLFYVVTGLIGVVTWRFPKDGLVVSYLVMSILSTFASIQLMSIAAFSMRMETFFDGENNSGSAEQLIRYQLYGQQISDSNADGFSKSERLALEILIFFIAFVETVFVIIMAVATCSLWPTKSTNEKKDENHAAIDDKKNDFDLKGDTIEKPAFIY